MRRYRGMLLCLVLCVCTVLLSSCGSSVMTTKAVEPGMSYSMNDSWSAEAEDYALTEASYGSAYEMTADKLSEYGEKQAESVNAGEKIIYSVDLSLETTAFDETIASLDALVSQFQGYVQYSSVNGDTRYNADGTSTVVNRYANYQIAVPVGSFETALGAAEQLGNVTNKVRSAENVTSQYTDIAARLESLRVQEERILALMEESDDINGLIVLEERLSEITYQKESYQRQMDNLERRIAYSNITVNVREVSTYTPTVPVTRSFGERLADAFSDGWHSFARGWEDFLVWFAESLPGLLLFAVIVVVLVLIIRMIVRRATGKTAKKKKTAALSVPTLAEIEAKRKADADQRNRE